MSALWVSVLTLAVIVLPVVPFAWWFSRQMGLPRGWWHRFPPRSEDYRQEQ